MSHLTPSRSGRAKPTSRRPTNRVGGRDSQSPQRVGSTSGEAGAGASAASRGPQQGGASTTGTKGTTQLVHHIFVDNDNGGTEMRDASGVLVSVSALRQKYKSIDQGQVESDERLDVGAVQLQVRSDGVIFFEGQTTEVVPWEEYYDDIQALYAANDHAACNATCTSRLQVLEEKYRLHGLLNSDFEERVERNRASSGLFANSMRVDNYVHLQAGMNAQALVDFIRAACEFRAQDNVRLPETGEQTLQQLLDSLDITLSDTSQLTVEGLGLHPSGEKRFIRFDVFDPEVNKGGKSAATLLGVFLHRESSPNGRLFAEIVRPLVVPQQAAATGGGGAADPFSASAPGGNLSYIPITAAQQQQPPAGSAALSTSQHPSNMNASMALGQSMSPGSGASAVPSATTATPHHAVTRAVSHGKHNQATEYTIPVYGNADDEWQQLAKFLQQHKLANPRRNMYIIEIPRIASMRKTFGFDVQQQHLERLFLPLFLATRSPEDDKHADVAWLLSNIGGFTIRSDEDNRTSSFSRKRRPPGDVPWNENPCDLYFAYYFWANLTSLNAFRKRRNMNTFELRANAGERNTQLDSLMYSFLLSDSISHGVLLDEHPVLQYLYGMNRIGVAMSPLTNNATDVEYTRNPFQRFFIRSLNVTLCTDSPLHYHDYDDPLLEEYSTAAKLYRLSPVDVSELSRNSILMSAFPRSNKTHWLGTAEFETTNIQQKTCVPDSRIEVRRRLWESERMLIAARSHQMEERRRLSAAVAPRTPRGDAAAAADGGMAMSMSNSTVRDHILRNAALNGGTADKDPLAAALVYTAREAEELAATHGFAAGGKFRLLPGGTATEKLAVYVTVDRAVDYPRIKFVGPTEREGTRTIAAKLVRRALETRKRYILSVKSWEQQHRSIETAFDQTTFDEDAWEFGSVDGVVVSRGKQKVPRLPGHIPSYSEFYKHFMDIKELVDNVHVKKLSFRRLKVLEDRFRLHHAVSHSVEASNTEDKASSNRDFYQTCKVDTNVRMENGMTARQLLNFILSKARQNADDIVCHREGQEPQTLRQLLQDMDIDPTHLTVDDLNVQVDNAAGINTLAFTPEGRDQLLTLLLKTDNEMKGRYFAELTKLTFEQFKRDAFTFAENRLPIYGAAANEWDLLSSWFDTHGMACYNNMWMIQFPRIYSYLYKQGRVKSFSQYIEHIFLPLWAVSLHPSQHPRLFHFLNHVSGFDCVEDERTTEMRFEEQLPPPQEWTSSKEPPYNYYLYYFWANIRTLNEFRQSRSFSTFSFRPSCGEAGSIDHMLGGFLVANGVSYGLNLRLDPAVQYLYYLAQVGIAVSPLSNNTKLLEYLENPFPEFFRRGLNISLSTDSPLLYHHTQEPLIEEYSIASKVWKLSPTDMCEIARNSVLQSGFGHDFKKSSLGPRYFLSSSLGNDEAKTHLSSIRVAYRWETYHTEISLLEHMTGETFARAMLSAEEEGKLIDKLDSAAMTDAPKGIIAASTDEAAMTRLRTQRDDLSRRLAEVSGKLEEQKEFHRLMSDRYHDATSREAQLTELRKTRRVEREAQIATMQAAANLNNAGQAAGASRVSSFMPPAQRTGSFAPSNIGGRQSRRSSNTSAVDLNRTGSMVAATTHFEGSDDASETSLSQASRSLPTARKAEQPATDFRAGTETPWSTGPLFANPAAPGAQPTGRRPQLAEKPPLDEDVVAVTRDLLSRMPGGAMRQGGAHGFHSERHEAESGAVAMTTTSRKLPGGGVVVAGGGSGPQQHTPQPPPRRQ